MKKILIFILIIFLPLYLLLKSVEINTFDKEFYIDSYEKYGVLKVTGKTIQELEDITDDLLSYLKGKADEKILEKNFNSREILHMIDVKVLFDYGYMLKNISLILILLSIGLLCYFKDYVSLGKTLFYGPFIWWGAILILFLLSLSDFNRYFTYFHLIFFDNDLWLLNPETDLLIQMLPLEFFISIFKKIVLLFLLLMAILQIIGYVVMRKGKDWSEKFN
ncbi:MAG: TIGR01906 family membrane protein [Tissierellales bacterium]|jgi:integral membrane protein (TIGR01906 family)